MDRNILKNNRAFTKKDFNMRRNFHHFKIKRGVLYREISNGDEKLEQLVLPEVYRKQILEGLHDDIKHPGCDRTISLLRESFLAWNGSRHREIYSTVWQMFA